MRKKEKVKKNKRYNRELVSSFVVCSMANSNNMSARNNNNGGGNNARN
jgi:hypothetical protein